MSGKCFLKMLFVWGFLFYFGICIELLRNIQYSKPFKHFKLLNQFLSSSQIYNYENVHILRKNASFYVSVSVVQKNARKDRLQKIALCSTVEQAFVFAPLK